MVAVEKVRDIKIINCIFVVNKQTALRAFDSTLYFGGHVIFSENCGTFGGAMILLSGSAMYLMPHTHTQIMNNHAKRGGGIYVEDDNTVTITPCFFQLLDLQYPQDTKITLENNTADEAGSAVYGGEIDRCLVYLNQMYNRIDSIFTIISSSSVVSQVSSTLLQYICVITRISLQLDLECILGKCSKFQ